MTKRLHTLAKIALITTYLVIIAGAVVRMTGSGMGCPDWPKCFGYYVPPTDADQLKWKPNHDYKKGVVIILNEALFVAKVNFKSATTYNPPHWEAYTKHDYAVFNPLHTWVEYINRLLGALAGFATLIFAVYSLKFRRKNLKLTLWAWLVVFGMGFQGWLGKTVVDSNLAPIKITIHMIVALLLVAALLYIVFKTSVKKPLLPISKTIKTLVIFVILLTIIQIIIGTQVRQFIDMQIKTVGYNTQLWLNNPSLSFYIHRSFSVVVALVHFALFYVYIKQQKASNLLNFIMFVIILEIVTGIVMNYFNFPFSTQTLHLVLASILFGLEFYLLLLIFNSPKTLQIL